LEVEGGSDSDVRYSDREPLPAPAKLAAGTENAAYLQSVADAIQPAWSSFLEDCRVRLPASHELNTSTLETKLVLVLNREGTVLEVRSEKASGNAEFDQVALEISGDLAALPKPPPSRLSDDDRVYLVWGFARDKRQAGPATATWKFVELPLVQALPKLLAGQQFATATKRVMDSSESDTSKLGFITQISRAIVGHELESTEPERQALALHSVGKERLTAYRAQVRAAARSTEPAVAVAAINALASIGDASDSELLLGFARGASGVSAETSIAAALTLKTLGKGQGASARAIADLQSDDDVAGGAALAVLSVLSNPDSVAPLSALVLGKRKATRAERTAAAAALGKQAPQSSKAVKALLSGTADGDASIRLACTAALADATADGLSSRTAYWRALELFKDKDERVRAAAILAAAGLDASRFGKELPAIRAGGSNLVVLSLAQALAEVPGPVALDRLLDLAAVPDESMRIWAAKGLAKRTEPKAVAALEGLLSDDSAKVRFTAIAGVADNAKLLPLLSDASVTVQARALAALTKKQGQGQTITKLAAVLTQPELGATVQLLWVDAWLTAAD
tara:strand:- start:342271 stop:343980 length:1710 start_codon:yes stop_codon:yes gene_type:complete